MTLDELYNALYAAIQATGGQSVTLSPTFLPGVFDQILTPLNTTALQINRPSAQQPIQLTQTISAVTLVGVAGYRSNAACTATLVATPGTPNPVLTITLAVSDDSQWVMRTSFPVLPDSWTYDGNGALVQGKSYIYDVPVKQPAFIAAGQADPSRHLEAGLNFAGRLVMTSGPFAQYRFYFGDSPLPLLGTVDLSRTPPLMELVASVSGRSFSWGSTKVGGLSLRIASYIEESDQSEWSTAEVFGRATVGSDPGTQFQVTVSATLMQGDFIWTLRADLSDYTQAIQLSQLSTVFDSPVSAFLAPAGILFNNFYLSQLDVGLFPPKDGSLLPALSYVGASIMSRTVWTPPVPFVSLTNIGTSWVFTWPYGASLTDKPTIEGEVFGDVVLGTGGVQFTFTATIPTFIISGTLSGNPIDLGQIFLWFFQSAPPTTGLKVSELSFWADPSNQNFSVQATIDLPLWNLMLGSVQFNLAYLELWLSSQQNKRTAGILGGLLMTDTDYDAGGIGYDTFGNPWPVEMLISAEWTTGGGWTFTGELYPQAKLDLIRLAAKFMSLNSPTWLPQLFLERLRVQFNTLDKSYQFSAAASIRWQPDVLGGIDLSVRAEADIERRPPKPPERTLPRDAGVDDPQAMVLVGTLSGTFSINRFQLKVGINLSEKETTYLFSFSYGTLSISGNTAWVDTPAPRHQIVQFRLGGVTFGSIIEFFVNLARPTADFTLEAPWDFLNKIDLSRFTLTVDKQAQTIALDYAIDMNLTFIDIKSVGLVYDRGAGGGSVRFRIFGTFLNKKFDGSTGNPPLSWDAVDDAPPSVPGGGVMLLKLKYLGLGQHVSLAGGPYTSVTQVLQALEEQLQPIRDPKKNPLDDKLLQFDANSNWLAGLDITVMETVTLGVIFNDPYIYGLVVALGGKRAGSLSGLKFELLYRKITDDIGVFKVELRLPDQFRQLDVGSVAVTLGVIAVEIFTNGNFRVDLGFPYKNDFERSFSVEIFPFVGRGGLYFARLNGATSSRVPRITNGNFEPVLELGIGLSVGLGRDFNKGPLKAGLSVEVMVILEGVLGWFNPNDSSASSAMYYWLQGTAGIVGKIYGAVDFGIIKVSVNVRAYASATVVLEAYEPTVITLRAGVSVSATITILFIDIDFSFDLDVEESFTIGEKSTPPWLLAADQSGRGQARLRRSIHAPRRRTLADVHRVSRLAAHRAGRALAAAPGAYTLHWNAINVFPDTQTKNVKVKLIPGFAVAGVPVTWTPAPPRDTPPDYRLVFPLFVDNDDDGGPAELNVLIEALLRWSLSAASLPYLQGNLASGWLADLYAQMVLPPTSDVGFQFDNLSAFLGASFLKLQVSSIPTGTPPRLQGVAFPMIPTLGWRSTDLPPRDFTLQTQVGATYEADVARYFDQSQTQPEAGDDPEPTESMAKFVFRDWFLMLARSAVQAAIDAMAAWPYQATSSQSLQAIAVDFPKTDASPLTQVTYILRAGDTVDEVAAFFGLSALELLALNPNLDVNQPPDTSIPIVLGVTVESIALANQTLPLTAGLSLPLGLIAYEVDAGDSLQSVASRFGLPNAAALLAAVPPGVTSFIDDLKLPRLGATLTLASWSYPNVTNLPLDTVAAIFYVRQVEAESIDYQPWYSQAILDLTPNVSFDGPLPVGTQVNVPSALYDKSAPVTYTTVDGDRLSSIGAYFSLLQNFSYEQDPTGPFGVFENAVRQLNVGHIAPVALPPLNHVIVGQETFRSLAGRFFSPDLPAFVNAVAGQTLLAPRAILNVPSVTYQTAGGDTLLGVAAHVNLSVEDLASRPGVSAQAGLFLADTHGNTAITVKGLFVQTLDKLVAQVTGGDARAKIAGMLSRFMLHGLRLPRPEPSPPGPIRATGDPMGLYELVGQEVPGPAPPPAPPPTPPPVRASLTVYQVAPQSWVELQSSSVRAGLIGLDGPLDELPIAIDDQMLYDGYPAPSLSVSVVQPLAPLQLYDLAPQTYGLMQRLTWQAAIPVTLPGTATAPLAGEPSLWTFPGDLRGQAPAGGATPPFQLMATDATAGPDAVPAEVARYGWATLVELRIRRAAIGDRALPNTYELVGADELGRRLLLDLYRYLLTPTPDESASRLLLLWASSDAAANPSGLSSAAGNPAQTYVVKANLTTQTANGLRALPGDPPVGDYFASFTPSQAKQLLLLLWECSVVAGGGYYLGYADAGGDGLPAEIFDAEGNGSVWLAVLLGSQCAGSAPDRAIHSFNNCAVVGDNVDPTSRHVFAQRADLSQLIKQPSVPPGNSGFELTLAKPAAADKAGALYSLLGWRIVKGGPFLLGNDALPVGPVAGDDPAVPLYLRPRRRRGDPPPPNWHYHQVVPVARLAASHPLPACRPLPDPTLDPYAGIAAGSKAQLIAWFNDLYGNAAQIPSDQVDCSTPLPGQLCLPVGYADYLLGLGQWPGLTTSYRVGTAANGAALSVDLALQAAAYLPTIQQGVAASSATVTSHAQRYAAVYYQVSQALLTFAVRTSLEQPAGQDPTPLPFDGAPLVRFVTATCMFLDAAGQLQAKAPDLVNNPSLTLVAQHYGLSFASLAAVNGGVEASQVFGGAQVAVPSYAVFTQGDSAASICQRVGLPDPTAFLLQADNVGLPLRAGVDLTLPAPRSFAVGAQPPSLAQLAAQNRADVSRLATQNAATHGLFATGVTLTYQGLLVTVGGTGAATDSLNDLVSTLMTFGADSQTTPASVAFANQDLAGLFQPNVTLSAVDYITQAGETLAQNGSGAPTAALAAANVGTLNLMDAGVALYVADAPQATAGITLDALTKTWGITVEQLLWHNRDLTTLASPTGLQVPGAAALPDDTSALRLPYALMSGDSLDVLKNRFDLAGDKVLALATLNLTLPGPLVASTPITVGGYTVTTAAGDSLQDVLDAFAGGQHPITLSQLVAVIGAQAQYWQTGALLMTPPALAPPANQTFAALAQTYGLPVSALAAANIGLFGVIAPNVPLALTTPDGVTVHVTTAAEDTLNSVLARFTAQVATTLSEVLDANPNALLVLGGARLLLPPPPSSVSVVVGAGGPHYPAPIFPLTVGIEIARDPSLINAGFQPGPGEPPSPVQQCLSPVAPRSTGSADDPLRLVDFARDLQKALPSLRAATGRAAAATEQSASPGRQAAQDVWVVDFSPAGIQSVRVAPGVNWPAGSTSYQPRFFALKPLSPNLQAPRPISIQPLKDDGTLDTARTMTFEGVDLDVWARDCLAAIDLFLTAPYASPVYLLNGGAQAAKLESILEAKKTLAAAIIGGVDYVLTTSATPPPSPDPAKVSAAETLRQQLLTSLSAGYAVDVIAQYDAAVQSVFGAAPPRANLSGAPRLLPIQVITPPAPEPYPLKLSNAKTSLASGSSYVNFLLDVKHEEAHRSITLNLDYTLNELEFNIEDVTGGYASSNWLTFIIPLQGQDAPPNVQTTLGQAAMPLPLRSYPQLATLVEQTASASRPKPVTIGDAELWDYAFTWSHLDANADTIVFSVDVNQPPPPALRLADTPDLFAALAQYQQVAPRLWELLGGLLTSSAATPDPTLGHAVETLAKIVGDVAAGWAAWWSGPDESVGRRSWRARRLIAPPAARYDYSARLDSADDVSYDTLTLGYDVVSPWPSAAVPAITITTSDGTAVPLTAGTPSAGTLVYSFPATPKVPVLTMLRTTVSFPQLNIVAQQNAHSLVSVVRNVNLINGGPPTNDAFVYHTPQVAFADVTTPLLTSNHVFDFTSFGAGLQAALAAMYATLLGPNRTQQQLLSAIRYGYVLVTDPADGDHDIITYLPVKLKPRFTYDDSVPGELFTAMSGWQNTQDPQPRGGRWDLDVSVFSTVDPSLQRPILRLRHLVYLLRTGAK